MKSPFKFLDAYDREDREIFFGRDREIEELYQKVFGGKIILLYGISGTGKTSLINCGLANKFEESDWLPVNIRRGKNISESLEAEISKQTITPVKEGSGVRELIRSVYLDHFKPVFLIFDQFEELFIFGDKGEREEFIGKITEIVQSDLQCKCLFSIREEYLAGVTEFETAIPDFLSNRIRVERMTRKSASEVIEGPCRVNGITVEDGFADALLQKLNPDSNEIELTYLQVFLDRIFKLSEGKNEFTHAQIKKAGDVSDLLGSFLEEQIQELEDPDTGLVVLKAFVSMQGTKKLIGRDEIGDFARTLGKPVEKTALTDLLGKFVNLRVLKDKDEHGQYELRHDSLAVKIYEKITLIEKELLEVKDFLDNAFNNFQRRGIFLNAADLKYIAPFEDKIFLNKKVHQFIADSKHEIARSARRRRRLIASAAIVLIVILSFFTGWAMRERGKAVDQSMIAREQRKEAEAQREEAVEARDRAILAQEQADKATDEAKQARNEALYQKNLADSALLVAEYQRGRSEEQRKRAVTLFEEANQQRKIALTAREAAEKAAGEVLEANRNAMFQLYLFNAQEFASKSLLIEKNDTLAALLVKTAFSLADHGYRNYSDRTETAAYDARLYEAAQKALLRLEIDSLYSMVHWAVAMNNGLLAISDRIDHVSIFELKEPDPGGFPVLKAVSNKNLNEKLNGPRGRKISSQKKNPFLKFLLLDRENQRLISANSTGQVALTPLQGEGTNLLYSHQGRISSLIASPMNHHIISADKDGNLILYNEEEGKVSFRGEFGFTPVDLALRGERYLLILDEKGTLYKLDILAGSPQPEPLLSLNYQVEALEISDRLNCAAVAGSGTLTFLLLDSGNPRVLNKNEYPIPNKGMISGICFSPDGRWLALSGYDGSFSLWNLSEINMFGQDNPDPIIHSTGKRIRHIMFTEDSRYLIYSDLKSIHIYPVHIETTLEKLMYKLGDKQLSNEEWSTYVKGDIERPE